MSSDPEKRQDPKDEVPRLGFWESIPKRTLSRVVLLLALLAVIIYLRQRTGAIAGCMSDAFSVQPPRPATVKLAAPAGVRPTSLDADTR